MLTLLYLFYPFVTLATDAIRFLPKRPQQTSAIALVFLLLVVPLQVTTGSQGGDYAMACISICYVLKILELFFCSPELPPMVKLSHTEFLIRLQTYADEEFMQEFHRTEDRGVGGQGGGSSPQLNRQHQALRHEGRVDSARLLVDTLWHYLLMNLLALFLPPNPRQVFLEYSRWDWRYWWFMYLCGW